MSLKREIIITPAYDKRHKDPKKNYGRGACRIFFVVKGKEGAITLNFFTNWYLPSTIKEYKEEGIHKNILLGSQPISTGSWDYHSKKKREYAIKRENCEFVEGTCYSDGSCLRADDYLKILLEKGSKKVFDMLEKDYWTEFRKHEKMKLKYCKKCNQMTNHKEKTCLKCKRR